GTEQLATDIFVNLGGNADYTSTGTTFTTGALSGDTANVVVTAVDDRRVESSTETFNDQTLFGSSNASGFTSGSPNIAVVDNDSATVAITDGTINFTEGDASTSLTATLTLSTSGTGTVGLDVPVSANLPGNADYNSTAAAFTAGDFS